MSGTQGRRSKRAVRGAEIEWRRERERVKGGGMSLDGSDWDSIWIHSSFPWFPPCLFALSWYGSLTIKPPPTSLDVALPLHSPGHTQDSLVYFRMGKGCKRTAMPARRATGNTPQHGSSRCCCASTETQGDEQKKGFRSPELSVLRYMGTDRQTKNYFYPFLSHQSSHLSVC